MHEGGASVFDLEPATESGPVNAEPTHLEPIRPVRFAADAKQILATIIRAVYDHFNGPSCQTAVKRLDGIRRFFLRNNTVGSVMEPLLIFSLVQGNAVSALKFAHDVARASSTAMSGDTMQHISTANVPSNLSSSPGIYDPLMIVAYFDLGEPA